MFMNLDSIPPDHRMFTVYVGTGQMADEVDVVAPHQHGAAKQVQAVMEKAQAELKAGYEGQQVLGITNQSDGHITFNSAWEHFRPLPIEPNQERLGLNQEGGDAGAWEYLFALMDDNLNHEHDEYLDWLLEVSK